MSLESYNSSNLTYKLKKLKRYHFRNIEKYESLNKTVMEVTESSKRETTASGSRKKNLSTTAMVWKTWHKKAKIERYPGT